MTTYQKMQRSLRRKDRITSLMHAYYLGELLELNTNRPLRSHLNNYLSRYYSTAARRTYNLFEKSSIAQIGRAKTITLHQVYLLLSSDYLDLINS